MTDGAMQEPHHDEAEVRRALEACLRSTPFVRSPKLAAFLTFVVEEELAGRGDEIKAYTIAVRALGRSPGFDPVNDPSVRVEAGRLRRALDDAYTHHVEVGTLRIRIPTGGYRPVFQAVPPGAPKPRPIPVRPSPPAAATRRPFFDSRGQVLVVVLLAVIIALLCAQVGVTLSLYLQQPAVTRTGRSGWTEPGGASSPRHPQGSSRRSSLRSAASRPRRRFPQPVETGHRSIAAAHGQGRSRASLTAELCTMLYRSAG